MLGAVAVLAIVAEWWSMSSDRLLAAADLAVGLLVIAAGGIVAARRRSSLTGGLLVAAGTLWFVGDVAAPLLYVHRAVLVQVVLGYPDGRPRGWFARVVVGVGYGCWVVYPVARADVVAVGLAAAVLAAALTAGRHPERPRRLGLAALLPAVALALALGLGAAVRLAGLHADRAVLLAYDALICAVAVLVLADGRWSGAPGVRLADLVVDLGGVPDAGTLRSRLARLVGDPSLLVAYRLPGQSRYIDERGRPVDLPPASTGRVVTPVGSTAVLVHDASAIDDPGLMADLAAATRLAAANVRLQAELRTQIANVDASRRRIVDVALRQRQRLQAQLREGAERRLDRVAALIDECGPALAAEATVVAEARSSLRALAEGLHPERLTRDGLAAALHELIGVSVLPVALEVMVPRLPAAVEVAAFYVCAEALANATKHANASRLSVTMVRDDRHVVLTVDDDGVGGADPAGSGLRGLADRVDAVGGTFVVAQPPAGGTRITATFPPALSS